MEIIEFEYGKLQPINEKIVLCLGYFDGVHLGHKHMITKAINEGYKVGVLTFDNSPKFVLGKFPKNNLLSSNADKAEILSELGVSYLFLMHFDKETVNLTKDEFLDNVLNVISPLKLFCGEDFRFGARGEGTPNFLSNYFDVEVVDTIKIDNVKVSSRDIVFFINDGKIEKANAAIGRPYRINGLVVMGKQNGHKLDFPTANISLDYPYAFPKNGVYYGWAEVYGKRFKSMINVGTHPSVEELNEPLIEVHIIGFEGNLYGKDIFIEFIGKIRDEKFFDDVEKLKYQLKKDKEFVEKTLK